MERIKQVALVVIVGALVVGATFGLLASSTNSSNQTVTMSASIIQTRYPISCGQIPANFSNWVRVNIYANQTFLNLISLTTLTSNPSISLDMALNKTAYVFVQEYNRTFETVTVPLPDYWPPGTNVVVSVNYYYTGFTPSVLDIGSTKVLKGNLTC